MPPARRTQAERHASTHEALLSAAVHTLAARGAFALTQTEVSALAGVTKGAYNHHFASRDQLYEQVLSRCVGLWSEGVSAAWESQGTAPERVRAAVRALWKLRSEGGELSVALAEIMVYSARDPRLGPVVADHLHAALFELAGKLVEGMRAVGFRPKLPPEVVARVILGALDGMAAHAVYIKKADDAELGRGLETVVFGLFEA